MGVPDIDLVRPAICPACGGASRPEGEALGLHGHGRRERQVRGPPEPGFRPKLVIVLVRRFACQHCGAVITVLPSELEPRRYYSAAAIGWALALFGLTYLTAAAVADRVCAWRRVGSASARSWPTLHRWCRAVREGRLFPFTRSTPEHWSLRQVAERAATTLAAHSPPALCATSLDHQAWFGAAQPVMAS